jgi:pilus assembly protein CpaF
VLVLMAVDLPVASIQRQIASAIDIVVQITRLPGGRRAVTQVSEVSGYDADRKELIVTDIFNFRDGLHLRPTGYLPTFINELMDKELLKLEFLYGDQGRIDDQSESLQKSGA